MAGYGLYEITTWNGRKIMSLLCCQKRFEKGLHSVSERSCNLSHLMTFAATEKVTSLIDFGAEIVLQKNMADFSKVMEAMRHPTCLLYPLFQAAMPFKRECFR